MRKSVWLGIVLVVLLIACSSFYGDSKPGAGDSVGLTGAGDAGSDGLRDGMANFGAGLGY